MPEHIGAQTPFKPAQATAAALIATFRALCEKSPDAAARLALKLFLTPERRRPAWEEELKASALCARLQSSPNELALHCWVEGPAVLLSHCWGGRGTQLGAFVQPLLAAGYRVIAFDGPAHGDSQGSQTDMMEFSAAIHDIAQAVGPLHAIVGHSFGAATTLLTISDYHLAVPRIVLIGCFAYAVWITEAFGDALKLPRSIIVAMRARLAARYDGRLNWEKLDLATLAKNCQSPILLIHDEDDREIPFAHALKITAESDRSSLYITEGLGHRRILRDACVIDRAVAFIMG